jgi:choline dehydrogenase-like flavoprotein
MPQVVRSPKVYDVCIIGAGGGTAAKVLTEGGLNVVMLEAGPLLNPRKGYKKHASLCPGLTRISCTQLYTGPRARLSLRKAA